MYAFFRFFPSDTNAVSLEIEAGQSFKGFMIQARPRREDETIGTFVIPATSTSDAKTMHCNRPHVRVLAYQLVRIPLATIYVYTYWYANT